MSYLSDPLIMLVDDNEIDNFISKRLLKIEEVSNNVISFTSPVAAIEYLEHHKNDKLYLPEVILLDIQMPEMTGFEFLEHFNSLPLIIKNRILIYILSSTGDPFDIQKGKMNPNVKDVLNKPLDPRVLKKCLLEINS